MSIYDTRLQNGRKAIANYGGVGKLSTKMGYNNPSFLVQIFGPNPTRKPSERTCRRMEESMGLESGVLDQDTLLPMPGAHAKLRSDVLDIGTLAKMIYQVNEMLKEEAVVLSGDRVATLVSMAYEDGSTDRLRAVIRALR